MSALLALAAVVPVSCVPGSDDDVTESAGEVSSEPADTDETTSTTSNAESWETTESSTTTTEAAADPEPVRIDTATGDVEVMASFSQGPVNALTFLPDGRLLAADLEGRVSIVDIETGRAETVTSDPAGLVSSGDLAVAADGTALASATDDVSEYLVTVDVDTGEIEILTAQLSPAVYGLVVTPDGDLLGMTYASVNCEAGEVIVISTVDIDDVGYGSLGWLDFAPGGAAGR
ncbi:MAG: WD40 repeat domain-containing protein [Acidimicrobiia bacterium]|nr:WD40 repeat domain-containing protein [Acidimicrobiia bacterium]MDH5519052.1 WD40 repeat domain-containing protein [Acidimicrobiia bacterium]